MLARQAAIYLAANVFSALFGFLNVMLFTRLFSVAAYGDYLLGLGFATLFATVLATAVKFSLLRNQARGDGADVRGVALAALLLSFALSPLGYGAARLAHLEPLVAAASVLLTLAIVVFDASQELLRAEQQAGVFLRGVVARALLASLLGACGALVAQSGEGLLLACALAFTLAALVVWRRAWRGARPHFERAQLGAMARNGLPLTVSMSLLALAGVTDRFLLAHLDGAAAAGQFGASFDLVRQALVIPAISIASAFVPMAVRLHSTQDNAATRAHLAKCLELLLAITLPACVGFALVSPQIAALVLGPDFRETARAAMPLLTLSVVFQILTQQYLHTSFLLSNRNIFYLGNTASIVAFNIVVSYLLIDRYGATGAVWGRFATDAFGFVNALLLSRFAFAMPFPAARLARIGVAVALMAALVRGLGAGVDAANPLSLLTLIPAGALSYGAAAWLLDIGDLRMALRALPRPKWRLGGGASFAAPVDNRPST